MKKQIAAVTTAFALAGLGVATTADAHGRDHGHAGRNAAVAGALLFGGAALITHPGYIPRPYYAHPRPYYAPPPPPVYYQPPVYVAPQLPPVEVECYDKEGVDRYGYPVYSGSVRTYQDQNNGATFQRFSRQPCF